MKNLFVKFNCDCWGGPTCMHASSGLTVIIGGLELAHQVGSVIDGPTNSKALEVRLLFNKSTLH